MLREEKGICISRSKTRAPGLRRTPFQRKPAEHSFSAPEPGHDWPLVKYTQASLTFEIQVNHPVPKISGAEQSTVS